MTIRRSLIALTAALAVAALAAGCGGGDSGASTPAATAGGAPSSAAFNDADVTFAQGMIPHHEQAIEMADIALDPKVGASTEVKALASRIKAAQDPEIATMKAWLDGWGKPTVGAHEMAAEHGMMSADEMTAFAAKTGPAFDTAFYESMIRHHQGAVTMATTVQQAGSSPDVKSLAGQVISAQKAEIEEMTKALGR